MITWKLSRLVLRRIIYLLLAYPTTGLNYFAAKSFPHILTPITLQNCTLGWQWKLPVIGQCGNVSRLLIFRIMLLQFYPILNINKKTIVQNKNNILTRQRIKIWGTVLLYLSAILCNVEWDARGGGASCFRPRMAPKGLYAITVTPWS